MDDAHFRKYIIQAALIPLEMWSRSLENILVGTKNKESAHGKYLVQINMPIAGAKGIYQIESLTHRDMKIWLTNRINKTLIDKVLKVCYLSELPNDDALIYHLRYATIIAAIIYCRRAKIYKMQFPDEKDAEACFNFYKKIYNTEHGASTHDNSISYFKEACHG